MRTSFIFLLGLLFSAGVCRAQDDLPAAYGEGWYLATNSASEWAAISDAYTDSTNTTAPVPSGTTAIAEVITPELSALARSLGNDPTRIFNYVHDHIRYVHYFGAHKGAQMTFL